MWARKQCGILLLLASCAAAQGAAPGTVSVRDLRVVRDTSNNLRVEITLTAPLGGIPSATIATSPNRVVLDLPNTLSDAKQQQLAVNYKGVRRIRLGLNSANPPITRVVVEMDEAHPYDLQSDGTRVTLIIGQAPNAVASSGQGARAAGASGGLVGIFRRRPVPPPMESGNDSATGLPPPPPQFPPINFPEEQSGNAAGTSTASVSSHPTSSHPDRGSLQEGTVFPGIGSPGTGNVPTAQPSNPNASSGTVPAPGSAQTNGAGKTLGASIATDTGFPSVVATTVPSNAGTATRSSSTLAPPPTPETLSQISQSRTNPVSTASAAVEAPPQPNIVATPAPQPSLEVLSSISRSEAGPFGISKPAVQPPALPRPEPSAPDSQRIATTTPNPSLEQAQAGRSSAISTGEARPQSSTRSVPQNETPSS